MTQDIRVDLMLKKLAARFPAVKAPDQGCLLNFERKLSFGT